MPKKKTPKPTRSKPKAKKKAIAKKKTVTPSRKKTAAKKSARPAAKKKRPAKKKTRETRSAEPSTLGGKTYSSKRPSRNILSWRSAGQSGDVQGLSKNAIADSESVEELLEEGQTREAAAISGVEDALDADQGEVQTHEVLEDDVPEEYTDED